MNLDSLTDRDIQQLVRMGPRAVYGKGLFELAKDNRELIAMSADLGNSSGLDRLKSAFPNQFINVGIAEQNLIGVASGLANEGFKVFASSFAPFLTFRGSEQIRMNLGYMQQPVKLVSIGSGLSMGFLGNSHYGLEDLAVMRSIPGITIVSPADPIQILKFLEISCNLMKPVYIRLTGSPNSPAVYTSKDDFVFGKSKRLKQGHDVALIATGSMVPYSIDAAEKLNKKGISTAVFDFHTIKPLDTSVLFEISQNYTFLVTVEEHSKIGGLGGAIAEFYSSVKNKPRHLIIGLEDNYGKTAEYFYLLEKYGLTSQGIAFQIQKFMKDDK